MVNDPVLTLYVPRSVAVTALNALGAQPLNLVATQHTTLARAIEASEQMLIEQRVEHAVAARMQHPAPELPGS